MSGREQSEYLESAMNKIMWITPSVLVLIFVLIYLALKELVPTLILFVTLPFALLGGLIYIDILNFNMSVVVIVGFLALLGVTSQTAIVMIIYLQKSVTKRVLPQKSSMMPFMRGRSNVFDRN